MCSPSFPCAGSALSKPQSTMEPFCSKREQEGGWIRKYFILGIFFPLSHVTFKSHRCFMATCLSYPASSRPAAVHLSVCPSVCPRQGSGHAWSHRGSAWQGSAVPMAVGYSSTDRLLQWVIYCLLVPADGIQTSQPFIIHKWKSGT